MDRWNENGWRARDAWVCFAVVYGLTVAAAINLFVFSWRWPSAFNLSSSQAAFFVTMCGLLIAFGVTLAFTKVSSPDKFLKVFRLNHRPTALAGWGVLFGIGLAFLAMYFTRIGWTHDTALTSRFASAEPSLHVALSLLLLVGPFLEESMMRGFLYPAFRGSYPRMASTAIVVAMSLLMHPDGLSSPGILTLLIISLNAVLCSLRENSVSLWDCIICHLAYNGTLTLAEIAQITGHGAW